MANLVEDLGSRYVSEFFGNAYFKYDNNLYRFNLVRNSDLDTILIRGAPLEKEYPGERAYLPINILESIKTFSWPKLGYRNVRSNDDTITAYYITSQRNTRRGLSEESLQCELDRASSMYVTAKDMFADNGNTMFQVYNPKWFTYDEAISMLLSQAAVSVALSEDVCVVHSLDPNKADAVFEILFRGQSVASVTRYRNINFHNKGISNMRMFKKMLVTGGY